MILTRTCTVCLESRIRKYFHKDGKVCKYCRPQNKQKQTSFNFSDFMYFCDTIRAMIPKKFTDLQIDFYKIYKHIGPSTQTKRSLDYIIPISRFNHEDPEHIRLAHLPENIRWVTKPKICYDKFQYWKLVCQCPIRYSIARIIGIKPVKN